MTPIFVKRLRLSFILTLAGGFVCFLVPSLYLLVARPPLTQVLMVFILANQAMMLIMTINLMLLLAKPLNPP